MLNDKSKTRNCMTRKKTSPLIVRHFRFGNSGSDVCGSQNYHLQLARIWVPQTSDPELPNRNYRTPGRPGTMCYNPRHACRPAEARAGPVFCGFCALRPNGASEKTDLVSAGIGIRLRGFCAARDCNHFPGDGGAVFAAQDRKSTRLNSSHLGISYAVFC